VDFYHKYLFFRTIQKITSSLLNPGKLLSFKTVKIAVIFLFSQKFKSFTYARSFLLTSPNQHEQSLIPFLESYFSCRQNSQSGLLSFDSKKLFEFGGFFPNPPHFKTNVPDYSKRKCACSVIVQIFCYTFKTLIFSRF
jgi:hypothetical protein